MKNFKWMSFLADTWAKQCLLFISTLTITSKPVLPKSDRVLQVRSRQDQEFDE